MSIVKVRCTEYSILSEPDYKLISFLFNDDQYFNIQDAYKYNDQDVKLGMNNYHIELNEQIHSIYGGIENIYLQDDSIKFKFNSLGEQRLKIESLLIEFGKNIEIDLNATLTQLKERHQK